MLVQYRWMPACQLFQASIFQIVGHKPIVGHEINTVGHNQHLKKKKETNIIENTRVYYR